MPKPVNSTMPSRFLRKKRKIKRLDGRDKLGHKGQTQKLAPSFFNSRVLITSNYLELNVAWKFTDLSNVSEKYSTL